MPPALSAKPDAAEIERLIAESRYKTMTRFARALGRAPKSVMNIKYRETIPEAFIRQMATVLGVRPCDISDMPEEADDGKPAAIAS